MVLQCIHGLACHQLHNWNSCCRRWPLLQEPYTMDVNCFFFITCCFYHLLFFITCCRFHTQQSKGLSPWKVDQPTTEASMQPLVQTAGCFVTHMYTSQCHDICTSSIAVTPMHYTSHLSCVFMFLCCCVCAAQPSLKYS